MDVSVIIRSMDRPYLDRALASVAQQSIDAAEVLVVAACGPGHRALPERIGRFPLRLIGSDRRLSRSQAGNAGLDAARGNWVNFLDDDDEFLPDHLAVMQAETRRTDARLVYSDAEALNANGERDHIYGGPFVPWRMLWGGCFSFGSAWIARSLRDEGVRLDERFEVLEDLDLFVQCAQKTAFHHVPKITTRWYLATGASGAGAEANADQTRITAALEPIHEKWRELKTRLDAMPEARMERGREALSAGDAVTAIALLEPLVESRARDPNLFNLLGVACLRERRLDDAERHLRRASVLAPGHRTVLANLALLDAAKREAQR